jgi:fatty-acyl-CoA synthase
LAGEVRRAVVEALGIRIASLLVVRSGTISRTSSGKAQRASCRELQASEAISHRIIARL